MIKKEYIQPDMEIMQAEVEQMVALTVTSVQARGLDENLDIDDENPESDPWEDAW